MGVRARVIGALAASLALIAAGCSARTEAVGPRQTRESARDPHPVPSSSGSRRVGASVSPAPVQSDPTQPERDTFPDGAVVGAMARTYLRDDRATRLVVEIDFVRGRRPDAGALEHLEAILRRECRKPDGITIDVDDEITQVRQSWSLDDIDELEADHRDHRSSGRTATIWLPYLSGELEEQQGALGVAWRASVAAIFADQLEGAATTLIDPASIERSVLTHEVGHLLGLINLGYTSRYDHEDPEHPKHSRYESSVMFWAIEDISISSLLSGGPPDDFDRFDRGDLADLRAG